MSKCNFCRKPLNSNSMNGISRSVDDKELASKAVTWASSQCRLKKKKISFGVESLFSKKSICNFFYEPLNSNLMNGSSRSVDDEELASKAVSDMGKQSVQIKKKNFFGVESSISKIQNVIFAVSH